MTHQPACWRRRSSEIAAERAVNRPIWPILFFYVEAFGCILFIHKEVVEPDR